MIKWFSKTTTSVIILTLVVVLFFSCASSRNFSNVDYYAQSGEYGYAYAQLEQEKDLLYTKKDAVLYELDRGMLLRYNQDYEQSNIALSSAEKLIDEYFAISVTQTIGSYLLNDNVLDYSGEDYEDIYTNLFMALNYIHLGNTDAAFVEIRRFNNKIKLLSSKYTDILQSIKQQALAEGYNPNQYTDTSNSNYSIEFHDSAFARYISMILYRFTGDMSSAEIDKKFIETAFASQQQLYPFKIPKAIYEEFTIPEDKERLNAIFYSGRAPEKFEEAVRIPSLINDSYLKLAIPELYKFPSQIASVSISAVDPQGKVTNGELQIIESIENIMIDTFQQRQGTIFLKTLLRAIGKFTTSTVLTEAVEESMGSESEIISLFGNLFTELSEQADIRSSKFFPSYAWIGGINLDRGVYDVIFSAYDTYGNLLFEQITTNFVVDNKNVNLLEAVCLH